MAASAATRVLSVGFEFPGGEPAEVDLLSKQSPLDFDIVVFQPGMPLADQEHTTYNGKICLSDDRSFRAKEALSYWRRELADAAAAGKLVVIFLEPLEEVYVATGEIQYSGTGRNARGTRIVTELNSYHAVPVSIAPITASGSKIKLATSGGPIAAYWKEFASLSEYSVYFEEQNVTPLLVTKTGDRKVGGLVRSGAGCFLLLPKLEIDFESLTEEDDSDQGWSWTNDGSALGRRLLGHLLGVHDTLLKVQGESAPPEWASDDQYSLAAEAEIRENITKVSAEIETLENAKIQLRATLTLAGQVRGLLYEQGKPLEAVTRRALKNFGYDVTSYSENGSEFDVVFAIDGERYIGEVEGKDSKPINIDKFSQLERNINEDFAREDVSEYAVGVLFGNSHRLTVPTSREAPFTEKCITAAQRAGAVLVHTPDLFLPCQYLEANTDPEYAMACRDAIRNGRGKIAVFPAPPESPLSESGLSVEGFDAKI